LLIIFAPSNAVNIPSKLLALPCMLHSRKSNQTVTPTLDDQIELVVSMFMLSVDTRPNPALHCKGNAAVTSDGLAFKQSL
jgi:hypothetical protein